MSSYYEDRRPAARDRRRNDDYYDDNVYTNTRDNMRSTAVVKRRNDSPEWDEEVRRDFSPPGGGYYRETTIRKSGVRPTDGRRSRSFENDRYLDDDRSLASSRRDPYYGARRKGYDDRRDDRRSRYDRQSDYSSSRSRTPPKRERRKSMPEEALEAIGLGGLVAKLTGKSRSRSSSRDRGSRSRGGSRRDRSRSSDHKKEVMQQALKAAILAGAGAAFRAKNEPGGWGGEKGKRVLTAAFTAGGVDGFINRDKDPEKHKLRDTIGAAVAGIATDRVVNGPRSRSRGPNSRRGSSDRGGSRSRSRSKAGDLLAGGAIAAAAKKFADSVRGRSSSRGRDRSRSRSYDSRESSRAPTKRSRSRSVLARGLSKVGLDKQADKVDPYGARERSRSRGPRRRSRSRSRYADDEYIDNRRGGGMYDPPANFDGRGSSVYDNRNVSKDPQANSRSLNSQNGAMISRPDSVGPGGGVISPPPSDYTYDRAPRRTGDPETDSDNSLGSSSEDEKQQNKSRKRLAISGGLATVATIHAGNSVYQSMEKRGARKKALHDGTISKEQAQAHKTRDRMQDAASIGLAALGLKGAYSEWKEIKQQNDEWNEELEKRKRHAEKRKARRRKMSMVGMTESGYSNSAPTLGDPSYSGQYGQDNGPYMSGANGYAGGQQQHGGPMPGPGMNDMNNSTQYFDDNPYGWANHQQQQDTYGHNNGGGGGGGILGNTNYGPPPPQAGNGYGSGFPPPPGGQPPPPQNR